MTNTTYYNLNIVEGTDIVNPLTIDNPNYEKIDEEMHNNAVAGVTLATEITNATVHAITRENSDCSAIRFIATSRWKAGDTATVDGVPVTALLPSGETLPDGAYVINANVLCILTGTNLTFYVGGKNVENASDIKYNDTNVKAELDALNGSVEQINSNLTNIKSVKLFGDGIIHKCALLTDFSLSDSVFNYDFIIVKWAWAGINNMKSEIMLTKGTTVLNSTNTIMFYSNGEVTTVTSMPIAVGKIVINGSTISARFNANNTEWQTGLVEVVGFKL